MSKDTLTAAEAAARLGVQKATLYTYVSRGLVRALGSGRARRYPIADIDALRAQSAAARGREAAASSSMDFGAPIFDSSITSIDIDGPNYRGRPALELVDRGVPYEAVAELLWTGTLPVTARWPACDLGFELDAVSRLVPPGAGAYATLGVVVAALSAGDALRLTREPAAARSAARATIRRLAAGLALAFGDRASAPGRVAAALAAPTIAAAVRAATGGPSRADPVVDRALVLVADHELNASSFAARIAAGTGADDGACVASALATLSGPRHGGLSDRIDALLADAPDGAAALRLIAERGRRGEEIPGFGHKLYADGDPRAAFLLADARRHGPERIGGLSVLIDAMALAGHGPPVLDVGLVAACAAIGLPPGSAAGVFAVGRCAGWIAHAAEQRASGQLIRPRARYQGA